MPYRGWKRQPAVVGRDDRLRLDVLTQSQRLRILAARALAHNDGGMLTSGAILQAVEAVAKELQNAAQRFRARHGGEIGET